MWHSLPSDVLRSIFTRLALQSLPRVCRVCKRWRAAAREIETFSTAQFTRKAGGNVDDLLVNITKMFDRILALELTGCKTLSSKGVHFIAKITSLRSLDLSQRTSLQPDDFLQLTTLTNLERLSLRVCRITNLCVAELTAKLSHLTALDISLCPAVTDAGVSALIKNTPTLRELRMIGLVHLTDEPLRQLTSLQSLTTLDLRMCLQVRLTREELALLAPMAALQMPQDIKR